MLNTIILIIKYLQFKNGKLYNLLITSFCFILQIRKTSLALQRFIIT